MNDLESRICRLINGANCQTVEVIQQLWSGYGVIQRMLVDDRPIVVKHIDLSKPRRNRLGWDGEISHQRKLRSYAVESEFYQTYSIRCSTELCRVPQLIGRMGDGFAGDELILVLEDLNFAGFPGRLDSVHKEELIPCLRWLANFHATFLGVPPDGLWPTGTYWHLDTRPQEYQVMKDGILKSSAKQIDRSLNCAKFQTILHGDAKLANFCFTDSSRSATNVAAVDFQYCGQGVGVKDVAYFVSSCLDEEQADRFEDFILDEYFRTLSSALDRCGFINDIDELEAEWRYLYPFAWADFCRFLTGWSPEHWKLNHYSEKMTRLAIERLES